MSNIFGGSLYFDNPEGRGDAWRTVFLIIFVLILIILSFINIKKSYLIGSVLISVLIMECIDGGVFSYLGEKSRRLFNPGYTRVE